MDARRFNSHMHYVNEKWAAGVLNMKLNSERGPDLIDDKKAVEVKFERIYPGKNNHKCWRFLGHQLEYDNEHSEIYWGLGFYYFNKKICDIAQKDLGNLESFVDRREIYIVKWDWMRQFPLYHQKGKTFFSEWDHYIGYPKFSKIPEVISSRDVEGGNIFFTEGVDSGRFDLSSKSYIALEGCPF